MCRAPTLEEKGQAAASAVDGVYTWRHPTPGLPWRSHFSSLLLSADVTSTLMELALLSSLTAASLLAPSALVDTPGSMPLRELALFMWLASALRKLYNAYLEAIYFARPAARTQPAAEHALKSLKDLNGRDAEQLAALVSHDRLTLLSQFALVLVAYRFLPGCYPSASEVVDALPVRAVKLLAHHYLLSFGMYWMHRSLHVIDPLWRHIHSIHHWAKHPLSRNTYQDHWLDNFGNALVGELLAQILVPIDHGCFWFSRLFRIMESLEKHSGVCGFYNLAHSLQRWMPYAHAPPHPGARPHAPPPPPPRRALSTTSLECVRLGVLVGVCVSVCVGCPTPPPPHPTSSLQTGITKGTKAATTRLLRSAASGTASSARARWGAAQRATARRQPTTDAAPQPIPSRAPDSISRSSVSRHSPPSSPLASPRSAPTGCAARGRRDVGESKVWCRDRTLRARAF